MRSKLISLCLLATGLAAGAAAPAAVNPAASELARWRDEARRVEIVRDSWGIAHVYGHSDADAVFGAMYAQAEDDFGRIERNYLTALGWLARAEGESAVYSDLRQRLFLEPEALPGLYARSPAWLKSLMTAWADGLNFYLATHPKVEPRVIRHFEPWMALSFTEGSIGGDVESVDLAALRRFYGAGNSSDADHSAAGGTAPASAPAAAPTPPRTPEENPGGSNGFAIAPRLSASGHALLWINPHTSFYFRAELQMVSDAGLDTYGAATWGQFFIYQGWNEHNGWMHTSYGGDAIDEYAETVQPRAEGPVYRYARSWRPLRVSTLRIAVRGADGRESTRSFTVYHSHHGPIVRTEGERWIAVKLLVDPVRALSQSYLRTKTRNFREFRRIQGLRTDTSNNTVYADGDGTIAYFHGNFIPRRDPRFDYTHPVDGSDPATEWRGPHRLDEIISVVNPRNGWLQNTNNWPFSAAGPYSPKRDAYPAYMWTKGENPRGVHAVQVLSTLHDVTLDKLIGAAYDPHLTAFDVLLPPLLRAYDALPATDPRQARLAGPVAALRAWDHRSGVASIPTSLAIFWGQTLVERQGAAARSAEEPVYDFLVEHLTDAERLAALDAAVAKLDHDFGDWRTPWGEINRYQRRTDDVLQPFDDAQPSLPVGFAPSQWGSLASFDWLKPRTTRRIYGSLGNSFVAAVEFGPTVRAKAVMTGGESGNPASPHFADQAPLYAAGIFRDVYFTRADVRAHAERTYHPGTQP